MRLRAAFITMAAAGLLAVTAPAYAQGGAGSGGSTIVTPSLSTAPVYGKDFPDPSVLYTGGQYVAYATGTGGLNLQMMTSTDLLHWGTVADPLLNLPTWALPGWTWAPGVIPLGGKFVMYYTARDVLTDKQCVGVATSTSATGPFVGSSLTPLVCQTPGSIDPNPYIAPTGVPYLIWKSDDNSSGARTNLWSQRLSADGLSLIGSPSHLL
ncbi:MAG TPA: family 43 glycosylhydrolase, partial [Acidimicrobiales bacterium]